VWRQIKASAGIRLEHRSAVDIEAKVRSMIDAGEFANDDDDDSTFY